MLEYDRSKYAPDARPGAAAATGPREPDDMLDEWAACGIERAEDIKTLFVDPFYFGCEADDPLTALSLFVLFLGVMAWQVNGVGPRRLPLRYWVYLDLDLWAGYCEVCRYRQEGRPRGLVATAVEHGVRGQRPTSQTAPP